MREIGFEAISDAGEPGIARTKVESPPTADPRRSPEVARTNSEATDTSGDRTAKEAPRSRWRRPLLILGPVVLVVGALCLYLTTGRYVMEEDVYVQAVNVSVSPQVSGQVVAITAKSNTLVRKNDPLFSLVLGALVEPLLPR